MPIVLTPKWLLDLLNSKATYLQYHAFQKGIRHNHKLEGAVAIARLGGSKEYVEKYFDVIDKRYLKYTGLEDDETQLLERDFLQSDKLEDYRGKNQAYYKMLSMYTKLYETKYDKNIKKMIQGVCPDILDGPLHSSFHGAIQLAYGLVCGCDQAVLEGITFMDQQYSPVFPNDTNDEKRKDLTGFGHGKKDIFELLNDLASNTTLKEKIKLDHQKGFEFRKQNHMYGAYGWSALQYHSEYFFELTNSIALPEWFVVEDKDMTQLFRLFGWVVDVATKIYVKSKVLNDFFLLHGITGSWSYSKIADFGMDFDVALLAIRAMLFGLLVTYITQDTPALVQKPEEYFDSPLTQDVWNKFLDDLLKKEVIYEFHVYKVIQCVYERWMEQNGSGSSSMDKYYMAAAKIILNNSYPPGGNIPIKQSNILSE